MTLRIWMVFAIGLLMMATTPASTAGENPEHGACNTTDNLVCTGTGPDGRVDCGEPITTGATCNFSAGRIFLSFSPLVPPGQSTWAAGFNISTCSSVHGCETTEDVTETGPYDWTPPASCTASGGATGTLPHFDLALGDCVVVSVHVWSRTGAWVPAAPVPALAHNEENVYVPDEVCNLDDGR